MNATELCELAHQFVRGGAVEAPAGPAKLRHAIVPPPHDLAHFELERDEAGVVFALHLWPTEPLELDLAAVQRGLVHELPRLVPDAPRQICDALDVGLVVLELAADQAPPRRLVAVHAYRFGPGSLAGMITTEAHVIALFELVDGGGLTRDAAHRFIGRPGARDGHRLELVPRPSSNVERANLERSGVEPYGLWLELRHPLALDLDVLARRLGPMTESLTPGFPRGMMVTARFSRGDTTVSLTRFDEGGFVHFLVRRLGATRRPPVSAPAPRAASPATDHVVALAEDVFARGLDEAAVIQRLLDAPGADGAVRRAGGRTRIAPTIAGLDGAVLTFGDAHATLELELAPGTAIDPRRFAHLGDTRPVAPLHACGPTLDDHRISVRGVGARGCILVAADRISIHRQRADAWLGDFMTGADLVALITRFLDEPPLRAAELAALVGHAEPDAVIDDRPHHFQVCPFAGGNVAKLCVYYGRGADELKRFELELHAPVATDFRELARAPISDPTTPAGVYTQEVQTPGCIVTSWLRARGQPDGPIHLVHALTMSRTVTWEPPPPPRKRSRA